MPYDIFSWESQLSSFSFYALHFLVKNKLTLVVISPNSLMCPLLHFGKITLHVVPVCRPFVGWKVCTVLLYNHVYW